MVARLSKGPPSYRLRSGGLPLRAYDELIRYSREYAAASGRSALAGKTMDPIVEVVYLVLRLSKGDVRLRLGTLARKLGVESRVLNQRFQALYGATPKDCQIRFRMEWVCNAIRTSPERKIGSVAADSGYSDVADFNHAFRKYIGVSPRQFQEACRRTRTAAPLPDTTS